MCWGRLFIVSVLVQTGEEKVLRLPFRLYGYLPAPIVTRVRGCGFVDATDSALPDLRRRLAATRNKSEMAETAAASAGR
jgi:hypothetical protein